MRDSQSILLLLLELWRVVGLRLRNVRRRYQFQLAHLIVLLVVVQIGLVIYTQLLKSGDGEEGAKVMEDSRAKDHVFIYKSFLYPNSTSFGTYNRDTLVTLFIADKEQSIHSAHCYYQPPHSDASPHHSPSKLIRVISADHCRMKVFVSICSFPMSKHEAGGLAGIALNPTSVATSPLPQPSDTSASPIATFSPSQPTTTNRRFVICMSRVFAFEKWQLLSTVMEIYRHLKVDLIFTHVKSSLSSVHRLMQAYEGEGLLMIREGLEFPWLDLNEEGPFDPNGETEHTNQLTLAHECFYEFREKTDFIALMDWDDLILTREGTLYEAFHQALTAYPTAAYFSVNKLQTTFIEQGLTDPSEWSVAKQISTIRSSFIFNEQKIVVVPEKMYGFWAHDAHDYIEGAQKVWLTTNYSLILHLAKKPSDEFHFNYMEGFDIEAIERSQRKMFDRERDIVSALPLEMPYTQAIGVCSSKQRTYYKVEHSINCLGYPLCELPQLNVNCTYTHNVFTTQRMKGTGLWVHTRRGSEFKESEKGCAVYH